MLTPLQFLQRPKTSPAQFVPAVDPGPRPLTILVSSHIWWVDCIAYALACSGHNVLVTQPWYAFFTDDQAYARFDDCWDFTLAQIRNHGVHLILGGNSTAIVPHPRTGELLHHAAGVPAVNYWWDEPRQTPPLMRRGHALETYLAALRDSRTLNAIWDVDVAEEMTALFGLENVLHLPLATEPGLWPDRRVPLERRQLDANFLGYCFHADGWEKGYDSGMLARAQAVASIKAADLDLPMLECLDLAAQNAGFDPRLFGVDDAEAMSGDGDGRNGAVAVAALKTASIQVAFRHWSTLEMTLRQRLRYDRVRALHKHLGDRLVVCGKGWESMGIKPHKEHSGVPGAADYYLACKASINLFGGCVHGGMPLRPYEIACSGGLIVTQHNRELPGLFEPGRECLAFRDDDEMIETVDRVLARPADFNGMVDAARRRVLAEHTWSHRMKRLLATARERFDLP